MVSELPQMSDMAKWGGSRRRCDGSQKSAFVEAKWRHLRMGYIFGWVPQIKLQVLVWFPWGRVDL